MYVDGAHSAEYVENDTAIAFEIANNRGAVVWDDYSRHVSPVADYLNHLDAPNLYRIQGTRLVVSLSDRLLSSLEASAANDSGDLAMETTW